jgi:hypothetical protein
MRYIRKKKHDYVSPCDQLMKSQRQRQANETETQYLERIKHEVIFKARDHAIDQSKPKDLFDESLESIASEESEE